MESDAGHKSIFDICESIEIRIPMSKYQFAFNQKVNKTNLTNTTPSDTRNAINAYTLVLAATGVSKVNIDATNKAAPNILVPPIFVANQPPGICNTM